LTLKKVAIEALASKPCRTVLNGIARIPIGKRTLNAISSPHGWYATFDEAWTAARQAVPVGHEDPGEIEVHLRHSEALRPSDYAALYWISHIYPLNPKIFDFGGNVGNLYYSYSPRLPDLGHIEWTVFDIPAVLATGRKIALERKACGLRFADSVDAFEKGEILLVSGAFHYWEQDVSAFLRQFRNPPQHIIINRSPVHDTQPSFITVQRTPTCAFPCRVWNCDQLVTSFAASGYKLIDRWQAMELSLKLPLFPDLSVPGYSGFYFSQSDQAKVSSSQ
jgi:putative methyltransferase (TIGR04325 family)